MRANQLIALAAGGALLGVLGDMAADQSYAPYLTFAAGVVLLAVIIVALVKKESA